MIFQSKNLPRQHAIKMETTYSNKPIQRRINEFRLFHFHVLFLLLLNSFAYISVTLITMKSKPNISNFSKYKYSRPTLCVGKTLETNTNKNGLQRWQSEFSERAVTTAISHIESNSIVIRTKDKSTTLCKVD